MKKLISVFLLVCALPATADSSGYHGSHFRGPGPRHIYYSYGDWVAPMIIGGGLVYLATRPVPVNESVMQPQPVYVPVQPQRCTEWRTVQFSDGTIRQARTCTQ
jgi:hypothetical protein